MVSFSNGSLSGEVSVSHKRSLENGHLPKFKPRRVSAIRDFPPGCGPNAVAMNVQVEENGGSGAEKALGAKNSEMTNVVVANGVLSSKSADVMESEAVENSEMTNTIDADGVKAAEIRNVEGSGGVKNSTIELECPSHEAVDRTVDVDMTESLVASVERVKANANGIRRLIKEIDNPVEEEIAESLDALVGKVTSSILGKQLNEAEVSAFVPNLGLEETNFKPDLIRPKDKYRRRRVSAVRDFPPNCGSNVHLPIEEETQIVVSGNDSLDVVGKVEVEQEATKSSIVSEEGEKREMVSGSRKERLDRLDNIHVKKETTGTLNDGAGRGQLGDVDSEESDRNVQQSNFVKTEGPIGKEIVVHVPERNGEERSRHIGSSSRNESPREIVHGLMAAKYCPWRKSKLTSNNSDCKTSGRKGRLQMSKALVASHNTFKADSSERTSPNGSPVSDDADASPYPLTIMDAEDHGADDEHVSEITPISMCQLDNIDNDSAEPVGRDIVVYSPRESDEMMKGKSVLSNLDVGKSGEIKKKENLALTVLSNNSDRATSEERKKKSNSDAGTSGERKKTPNSSWRKKGKAVAKKSIPKMKNSGSPSKKKHKKVHISHDTSMLATDENNDDDENSPTNSHAKYKKQELEISLPPFGPSSKDNGDARHKVRETLRLFNAICRKLLQKEEANSTPEDEAKSSQPRNKHKRIDLLAAKAIKDQGKEVNTSKYILGQVPGVEVGDEFQYRVELAVVGIHRLYQGGIDYMKYSGKEIIATSIVASGGYEDDTENADVLYYSGQGGITKDKICIDQKLERGNLALFNSIKQKTPVRVVRGWKETKAIDPLDPKPKVVTTYVYDGLYTVKDCETKDGPRGTKVFMFELRRNPGQPELAWKELKKSSLSKFRPGVCVADISKGKENLAICAVNTLNDEKPPHFNYVSKMKYPDWFNPIAPPGCDCPTKCSDSKKCKCAVKNGGEIPYNRNGAIVETKPLVYECGPHCKCPPSCYNRVTQRGIRFQLEIFKTESRGWGVRAVTSIPSGSFICEYAGELLEDTEAEQKIGNDEYLFDIGQNYSDCSVKPEDHAISAELMEEGGYTIDAAQFGNIGRFINHSCVPNLYAQNVIYDHDDKKMPHVMLFAVENIPPLKELTYHYNYSVDQIRDSNGNIKVKKCYCGTAECTGRMY